MKKVKTFEKLELNKEVISELNSKLIKGGIVGDFWYPWDQYFLDNPTYYLDSDEPTCYSGC